MSSAERSEMVRLHYAVPRNTIASHCEERLRENIRWLTENNLPCRKNGAMEQVGKNNVAAWFMYAYPELHPKVCYFVRRMKETACDDGVNRQATQNTLPSVLLQEGPNSQ